jgi:hypothetical protein
MKTRTSIRAGGKGCSPETQYYMQKAAEMELTLNNCPNRLSYQPPYQPPYGYTPPISPPPYGYVYPDRSGWCG